MAAVDGMVGFVVGALVVRLLDGERDKKTSWWELTFWMLLYGVALHLWQGR